MLQKLVHYLLNKHILTNFFVLIIFVGAIFFWNRTNKEAMPNITVPFVRVSANYPGATAEEVEYFVTKEIEEALEGIDGIKQVSSTSGQGSSSVRIELYPININQEETVQEIKDAVGSVRLPDEVENDPRVRQFKSSNFAIVDLMIYYDDVDIMTLDQRIELQNYIDVLEDKLLQLPSISDVGISGYLDHFIEIQMQPDKLNYYNISLSQVISAIQKNNLKKPLGSLKDEQSTKVRLDAELNDIEAIRNIIIRSDFEGNSFRLKDVAKVIDAFEEQSRILKVNGNEAIRVNVTKAASYGIIEAIKQVQSVVDEYNNNVFKDKGIKVAIMDDASQEVRNRLSLIAMNGLFGFFLILVILFVFLDAKSAVWVAMGIPFTFGATMIIASLMGNTINNITLAAVIIVMGMIVDDAIVVAENVSRLISEGTPKDEAVVKGTSAVLLPIVASITTTCVAFIPLFFFRGRFARMTEFIPPIIFIMLGASLFEAIFILPSHLHYRIPRWLKVVFSLGTLPIIEKHYLKRKKENNITRKAHWFVKVEDFFGNFLKKVLCYKWIVYLIFIGLLIYSTWVFITKMKFTMFPREETTILFLSGAAPKGTLKYETEKMVREVENIFIPYLGKEIIAFEANVALSRRGQGSRENEFSLTFEIVPKEKRKKSANQLMDEWQTKLDKLKGFDTLRMIKSRWGQSSGSAIDILVKENDNDIRQKVAQEIYSYLQRMPPVINPEIERELYDPEYKISLKRDLIQRLGVSADSIATTLRTILEGNNVYDISRAGKDIEVLVTVTDSTKKDIDSLLSLPVQNTSQYLVPFNKIVNVTKTNAPQTISRLDGKRTLHVYADLKEKEQKKQNNQNGQTNQNNRNNQNTQSNQNNQSKQNNPATRRNNTGNKSSTRNNAGTESKNWQKNADNKEDDKPTVKKIDLPEKMTPLEIASYLETNLFPQIMKKYPTTRLEFAGEIADTREAGGDFLIAIILVIFLIYIILALTLNSVFKPFIIMLAIPFGCVGIVIFLQLHGILIYGFFSAIGALGLAGVVVNDSIILLAKLEEEYPKQVGKGRPHEVIADISKTRLRAVLLTTVTTVAGLLPTAYGLFGYDSMLADMMLTMAWGLIFGTLITLILVPSLYCTMKEIILKIKNRRV